MRPWASPPSTATRRGGPPGFPEVGALGWDGPLPAEVMEHEGDRQLRMADDQAGENAYVFLLPSEPAEEALVEYVFAIESINAEQYYFRHGIYVLVPELVPFFLVLRGSGEIWLELEDGGAGDVFTGLEWRLGERYHVVWRVSAARQAFWVWLDGERIAGPVPVVMDRFSSVYLDNALHGTEGAFIVDDLRVTDQPSLLFVDGFESGDTGAWALTVP